MAYVICIILGLMVIGAFNAKSEAGKGARWLKDGIDGIKPALTPASEEKLITLLEQMNIEGCLYGPSIAGASPDNPVVLHIPSLSLLLEKAMESTALAQALPRLGFSIRSTA